MFGFYDPKTFKDHGDHGVITYIDAATGGSQVVEIRTADKAREIAGALGRIASIHGPITEIAGPAIINEGGDGYVNSAEERRDIPFIFDFDLDGFILPADGAARLSGVRKDGALIVNAMMFQPREPIHEIAPGLIGA